MVGIISIGAASTNWRAALSIGPAVGFGSSGSSPSSPPPMSGRPPERSASTKGPVTASRGVLVPMSSITPAKFSAKTAGSAFSINASVRGDSGVSGMPPSPPPGKPGSDGAPPPIASAIGSRITSSGVPVVPPSPGSSPSPGSPPSSSARSPPSRLPTVSTSGSPGPAVAALSVICSPRRATPPARPPVSCSGSCPPVGSSPPATTKARPLVSGAKGANAPFGLVRSVRPSATSCKVPGTPGEPVLSSLVPTTGAKMPAVNGLNGLSSDARTLPAFVKPLATPSTSPLFLARGLAAAAEITPSCAAGSFSL